MHDQTGGKKTGIRVAATMLAAALAFGSVQYVKADRSVEEIQEDKDRLQDEIDGLDSELVSVLADIEDLENKIAEKEKEIAAAKEDLKAAEDARAHQHADMKQRVKYMYENSDQDIVALMASSGDFAEFVNKVDYADSVHEYDRNMLSSYEATVEGIEALRTQLADDAARLESDKSRLQSRQNTLDMMLEEKKGEMADYDRELQAARAKAAEEARRREQEQARANARASLNTSKSYTQSDEYKQGKASKASSKGTAVARYASKFVGNPYVWGGNSLTEGCDCSGFVVQVYGHFDVDLSGNRTSGLLREVGRGVSYEDIQPGDIVCYDGHVAIYYGNGAICEAQSSSTGITIGRPVAYKQILAIRRIF